MPLEAMKQLKQEKDKQVWSKRSTRSKHLITMSKVARIATEKCATERVPLETFSPECVSPERVSSNTIFPGRLAPNEVLYQMQSKGPLGTPSRLMLDQSLDELALGTSSPDIPFHEDNIMHEICRQFSAIMKEPSQQHQGQGTKKEPVMSRISTRPVGRIKNRTCDSVPDPFPPTLSVDKPGSHGDRVLNGVDIIADTNYLVPERSGRISIANKMYTERLEDQRETAKSIGRCGGEAGEESSQSLRTILLLETMEEGEKETRIDGDGKKTFLIQTTMGEKETAIVGSHGCAMLLPTSELANYEANKQKATRDAKKYCSAPESQWPIESSHSRLSLLPLQLPEVKSESKSETEAYIKVKSESETEPYIKVKSESETEAYIKVKSESETEPCIKVKSESETEAYIKVKSESETEPCIKVKSESETEAYIKVKSGSKPETEPEVLVRQPWPGELLDTIFIYGMLLVILYNHADLAFSNPI